LVVQTKKVSLVSFDVTPIFFVFLYQIFFSFQ